MKQGQYSEIGNSQYQLMTSVSMPVYDLRHNEVSFFLIIYVSIWKSPINFKDFSSFLCRDKIDDWYFSALDHNDISHSERI